MNIRWNNRNVRVLDLAAIYVVQQFPDITPYNIIQATSKYFTNIILNYRIRSACSVCTVTGKLNDRDDTPVSKILALVHSCHIQ